MLRKVLYQVSRLGVFIFQDASKVANDFFLLKYHYHTIGVLNIFVYFVHACIIFLNIQMALSRFTMNLNTSVVSDSPSSFFSFSVFYSFLSFLDDKIFPDHVGYFQIFMGLEPVDSSSSPSFSRREI